MDLARLPFLSMFFTASVSVAIVWFSRISRVLSLCVKSLLVSAIFACMRATFSFAFDLFLEPRCFLARRRCNFTSFFSFFLNTLGAAIFSPVDSTAKWVSPRSIPICPVASGKVATASSQSIETKYRPAVSFETVTVVIRTAFGKVRDQRIFSGASIFASFNALPSHLKALLVYSADCLPSLRLKVGYAVRLAKKLANAVCKCRNACCTGTLETSLSQMVSGCFFSSVSAAEVSW